MLEMLELLKFACSGFWTFLGCISILGVMIHVLKIYGYFVTLPLRLWFRHKNIKAQGWPPAHVDADGDLKNED